MRILVLGASGMLGSSMIRMLANDSRYCVFGSARSDDVKKHFSPELASQIITGIDVENPDALARLFSKAEPEIVVNCIGIVKQLPVSNDPFFALSTNSLFPHRLARLCELVRARLVHISTDCVFSGRKGSYVEEDEADAQDLYGRSKLLGEVDYPHAVTLRTSIIGHELSSSHGLISWFLAQEGIVKGYTNAIFSGLPTCELSRVIRDFVLPHPELRGVYHVAGEPISKFNLLTLANKEYGKGLRIEADRKLKIDRSLVASRFQKKTGYQAPPWPQLIAQMSAFK